MALVLADVKSEPEATDEKSEAEAAPTVRSAGDWAGALAADDGRGAQRCSRRQPTMEV